MRQGIGIRLLRLHPAVGILAVIACLAIAAFNLTDNPPGPVWETIFAFIAAGISLYLTWDFYRWRKHLGTTSEPNDGSQRGENE
jgi:hypothetical protein